MSTVKCRWAPYLLGCVPMVMALVGPQEYVADRSLQIGSTLVADAPRAVSVAPRLQA